MLSYAFQVLKHSNYESVAAEELGFIQDLFAAILAKGVAKQLKQGLYREYVTQHETLSVMRVCPVPTCAGGYAPGHDISWQSQINGFLCFLFPIRRMP